VKKRPKKTAAEPSRRAAKPKTRQRKAAPSNAKPKAEPKRAKEAAASAKRRAPVRRKPNPARAAIPLVIPDAPFEPEELGVDPDTTPGEFTSQEPAPPPSSSDSDVAAQIRALEARLDGLIRGTSAPEPTNSVVKTHADVTARPNDDIADNHYFESRWGREGLCNRSEEVDDFGLDPAVEERFRPVAEFLTRRYFRTRVEGIEHIPNTGRCIVVANHSGTLPLDGLVLRALMRLEHPRRRDLRWLAEDFLFYLPFAGVFMNRVGAVRACQENAERLLRKEALVAVFPEGLQGIRKLFRERYQLQRFGRGGYVKLALRMQAPLVPCAIVGAEETNPLLYRFEALAGLFGLPYIPVTPTFPLLGPVGLLPAPARFRVMFGQPIPLSSYGPEAAEDHLLVSRLSERVRSTIQSMLDSGLRERRSVWFG
jgi:1-acyl-sn-glycerol-3-phosphate acyltransferase